MATPRHKKIKACLNNRKGVPTWLVRTPKDLRVGHFVWQKHFGDDKAAAQAWAKQLTKIRNSPAQGITERMPKPILSEVDRYYNEWGDYKFIKVLRDAHDRFRMNVSDELFSEVAARHLDELQKAGRRDSSIKNLRCSCKSLSDYRNLPVCDYTHEILWAWLASDPGWSLVRRKGLLAGVSGVFSRLVRARVLPFNPADGVLKIEVPQGIPCTLSVSDCQKLLDWLAANDPSFLAVVVPILFCGLRPNESYLVQPEMVRGDEIILPGGLAKNKLNRKTVINETAKRWLALPGVKFGNRNCVDRQRKMIKGSGVKWGHDILRHTFCSMAYQKWGGRLAAEMAGHSETVAAKHYRADVKDMEAFWNLAPTKTI